MKQLETDVIKDLINFYTKYIELGLTDEIKEQAKTIESKYLYSSTLISDDVFQLLGRLVDFYASTNIACLTISETKEKLVFLKKKLEKM